MTKSIGEIKETFGSTPKKTNSAEMQLRVEILIDQFDDFEKQGWKSDPSKINLTTFPKMKATHKVKWGSGFKSRKFEGLERFANVNDRSLRKAPINTIEGVTKLIDHNIEWLLREQKREEIRRRSAKEWRTHERAYVVKSRYTITDFYDDFKTLIEEKKATWSDYRNERKKWRTCKNRFCLELFPIAKDHFKAGDQYFRHVYKKPKNKHSKFCCDSCRKDHFDALKQFERTKEMYDNPTYLPQKEIDRELRLETSIQDEIYKHEISYQSSNLEALESGAMKYESFDVSDKEFHWGECVTYNINDLTDEEIREKKLEKYAKKRSVSMLLVKDSTETPLFFTGKQNKKEVI
ncbi:hypothetical protein [Heyndrickxia oleronia]|uniref:hypothetical protein n=1 Tax=Heyndrickxia oleronia TaxID=38875 RepID=UPI001B011C0A|nr:hypothetical protein [Heyndrickxia oleronia]GIN39613.1 hypothetical protein J19TS1_25620 [Heyndrickxia oleronia]